MLSFKLNCVPPTTTAQQRRWAAGKSGGVYSYKTDKMKEAEASIEALLLPHQPSEPVKGPVYLSVIVTFPWRKKDIDTKAKRDRALEIRWAHYDGKPDLSNWIKGFEDALVRLRFIEDDKRVAKLDVEKRIGNSPGIEVHVYPIRPRWE